MATAKDVVQGAATITNVLPSTLISIQRRYGESGLWPVARGPNVPELSTKNVAHFILGILADTKAKDVVASACAYYSLRNAKGEKLGDVLCRFLDSFGRPHEPLAAIAYRSRWELDCNSPRACLTLHCTDGTFQTLFGIQTEQWNDVAVRKSFTISGRSLFYFACGMFNGDWKGEAEFV